MNEITDSIHVPVEPDDTTKLALYLQRAMDDIEELEAELDRLRLRNGQYRVALHNHATDPDHPCSACQEMLLED